MGQMMDIIIKMSRGKGVVDDSRSVNTIPEIQMVMEGLVYSPCPTTSHSLLKMSMPPFPIPPLVSTFQETNPPHIPFRGVYSYPYIPPLIVSGR